MRMRVWRAVLGPEGLQNETLERGKRNASRLRPKALSDSGHNVSNRTLTLTLFDWLLVKVAGPNLEPNSEVREGRLLLSSEF